MGIAPNRESSVGGHTLCVMPLPRTNDAQIDILLNGARGPNVRSTCTLVRDHGLTIVIDPGMAPSQRAILDPLGACGVEPGEVTDVIISHHHPDHTINVGLFGDARVHDHWATYHHDTWDSHPAEGYEVSPSVRLWETPGHTPQDITTFIGTKDGLIACTHLWWDHDGPAVDPFAVDPLALRRGRLRVLAVEPALVIPGHGSPFRPDESTPR